MAIMVGAVAVLVLAGLLLVREIRNAARERRLRAIPPPPRSLAAIEPEAEDLTLVGGFRENAPVRDLRKTPLVRLGAAEDEEEVSSLSQAVTLYESNAEADEPTNPRELFLVSAVAQTDKGLKRRKNEDRYLIEEAQDLFLVADGIGGYAGGDVASRLAVETVAASLASTVPPPPGTVPPPAGILPQPPAPALELVSAIEAAHRAVVERAQQEPELQGMGTTIVGARFLKKKQRVYIAHVGDSRCYRLRRGELKQLTTDHTLSARGVPLPAGNSIRRAVGVGKRVKVDLLVDVPQPDDVYLLCSDGLNKMVSDETILETMSSSMGENQELGALARALVEAANSAGGKDNITALVARVLDAPPAG